MSSRPLAGLKAVSLASLGPGPYAAMLLSDLGCAVTIVDRVAAMTTSVAADRDPRRRGQRSIALDLKQPRARAILHAMLGEADILMEGMRPGVAERLDLAPARCHALNPGLIYARITGWGQDGPLAQRAGHDINYVALSGALHAMGDPGAPPPVPLNLLGDYAGGGLFVALGILAAVHERYRTGLGQVIDGAIVDGVASLSAATLGMVATGRWGGRGSNVLAGAAPWYRTYRTADDRFVAVGAIEPAFYAQLLYGLGLDRDAWPRDDPARWPALEAAIAARFAAHDRDHWETLFRETDACVTPVLDLTEAPHHPHHRARGTYVDLDDVVQPAPGPRLSAAAPAPPAPPPAIGTDTTAILAELGLAADEPALRVAGVVA